MSSIFLPPKPIKALVSSPKRNIGYELPMTGDTPTWRKVLRDCGYPETVLVLDFETFYSPEYSLKKMSTVEYVMDERFEVLCLSRLMISENFPDYRRVTSSAIGEDNVHDYLQGLRNIYGRVFDGLTVVAHNAPFDGLILSLKYGIHPRYIIDNLGLARAWQSRTKNDLGSLAKRLNLSDKGDTSKFANLSFRKRFAKPKGRGKAKLPIECPTATSEASAALVKYADNDTCLEWESFTILLPRLSRPTVELPLMNHTLKLFLEPTIEVDYEKGEELIGKMEAEIDKAMDGVGATRKDISGDTSFERLLTTAIHDAGDSAIKYLKQGAKKLLLAIAKTDPERKLLENHPSERVRDLMAARVALDSWPTHIGRIKSIMAQCKAAGGKLCVPLRYMGAHTGRWSGTEKINLQNLGSRGHALVNAIRELLISPDGETFVIVDASAIEARILAYVAGQDDLCEKFRNNEEIYCDFASKVLGRPVRKPKKDGIPAVEARHKWARNSIGKVGVLGCGYGMGTDRIFEYAGGAIDLGMALKIRDTYRAENPKIVQFWRDTEKAFKYAAKYQKEVEMARGLRFSSTPDCDVVITLPSGREIHYQSVRVKSENFRDTLEVFNDQKKCWEYIWGGTITENIVQAIARDILGECILNCEEAGIHIVHTCHDEVIGLVPDENGEEALAIGLKLMAKPPLWGMDLPLGAEGKLSKRYGDH